MSESTQTLNINSTNAVPPITYPATTTGTSVVTTQPVLVAPNTGQYFTAEQMEAARQQEKDKLYGRLQQQDEQINSFKAQLDELAADKKARDEALTKAAKEADEAKKREEQSKLTAEELIRAKEAELRQQQEKFQSDMDLRLATMQKEQEFLRLTSFIQRRVAEEIAADTIIPDLVEFIGGNTEAEVEASIDKVKEKTVNIIQGAATLAPVPQRPRGVSPTGAPAGPLDTLMGPKQYTKEEIEAMDMAEYGKHRGTPGFPGLAGNNRGMFN